MSSILPFLHSIFLEHHEKKMYITVVWRELEEKCKSQQLYSILAVFSIKFLIKWFIILCCSFIAVSFQLKLLWFWLLSAHYLHGIFTKVESNSCYVSKWNLFSCLKTIIILSIFIPCPNLWNVLGLQQT